MKNYKSILLGAVAVSSLGANTAFAQAIIAPVLAGSELKGAGATAPENVVVEAFNCISGPTNAQQLGKGGNANATPTPQPSAFATVPPGNFVPTSPTAANPAFNCSVNAIQPNFLAKYVATGSGFGREIWRNFSNRFRQTAANPTGVVGASNQNPFVELSGQPEWTNVQFAFSEGPISASDLSTYNTNANSVTNQAGKGIQIPLYVVPVAFSYSAQYGLAPDGVTPLNFQAPVGGIKMNQAQYCGVVNGTVTNFKTLSNTLKDPADSTTRWNADGVPIRLVGRLDSSGTTDIFTRHLKEVCGTTGNKFSGGAAATLPAAAQGTGRYINGVLTAGTETTGLFALATGNSGVRDAVAAAPNVPTASADGTLLNGKLGYNSGDFVAPAPNTLLQAAQLTQIGSTTAFKTPTAANATAAFATITPPQSISSGAYNASDLRKNSTTGLPVDRANPIDWADVLYSRADLNGGFTARTLAAPVAGYPITGVSFLLTSTCFKKDSDRFAMTTYLYGNVKKISKNSTGGNVSTSLFSGTAASLKGLSAQSNFAPLAPAWQKAILETFLQKTTGALGARGLFIQTKQPTTTLTGITSNTGGTDSNVGGVAAAACTAGAGA